MLRSSSGFYSVCFTPGFDCCGPIIHWQPTAEERIGGRPRERCNCSSHWECWAGPPVLTLQPSDPSFPSMTWNAEAVVIVLRCGPRLVPRRDRPSPTAPNAALESNDRQRHQAPRGKTRAAPPPTTRPNQPRFAPHSSVIHCGLLRWEMRNKLQDGRR